MSLTDLCLVLDIDETLVHTFDNESTCNALNIPANPKTIDLRSRYYNINVEMDRGAVNGSKVMCGIKRPHLDEFLRFCFGYCRLVIPWSAGTYDYVHPMSEEIFRDLPEPHAVLTRENCTGTTQHFEKPLWKLVKDLPEIRPYIKFDETSNSDNIKNILIIDDRKHSFAQNPNNGILIPAYDPSTTPEGMRREDTSLLQIMNWLKRPEVMKSTDVRKLDKSYIFSDYQPVDLQSGRGITNRPAVNTKKVMVKT